MSWYRRRGDEIQVRLRVQPRSSRCGYAAGSDGRLKLWVTAPPADGAANTQAIELLARLCGVSRSRVRLAAGATAREKLLVIATPPRCQPPLLPVALPASRTAL